MATKFVPTGGVGTSQGVAKDVVGEVGWHVDVGYAYARIPGTKLRVRSLKIGLFASQKGNQLSCKHQSGQIIATSHDLTSNGGLVSKGNPLISGKSRLVKYYNLARNNAPNDMINCAFHWSFQTQFQPAVSCHFRYTPYMNTYTYVFQVIEYSNIATEHPACV